MFEMAVKIDGDLTKQHNTIEVLKGELFKLQNKVHQLQEDVRELHALKDLIDAYGLCHPDMQAARLDHRKHLPLPAITQEMINPTNTETNRENTHG